MGNKKNLIFITLLFILSWSALVIFVFLFVNTRAQNSQLKNLFSLLEQKIVSLSNEAKQYKESRIEKNKWEEDALSYLQWQFVIKDQVAQAGQRLKEQIEKIKDMKKNKELTGLLYYNLGLNYTFATDFSSAINAFEEALRLDAKDALSYYNLGLLYSTYHQEPKKAVKYYKKYLELVPSGPKVDEVKERIKSLERE